MSKFVILGFLFISAMVTANENQFSPGHLKALKQNFIGDFFIAIINEEVLLVIEKTSLVPHVKIKNKQNRQQKPLLPTFSIYYTRLLTQTGFLAKEGV